MPEENIETEFKVSFFHLVYALTWITILPFLPLLRSVRPAFWQRVLPRAVKKKPDIWIQAASAGEAALVQEVIQAWPADKPLNILGTSSTQQGLQILQNLKPPGHIKLEARIFPFDAPWIMRRFLKRLQPKLLVLVETEMWPGLLKACRDQGVKSIIINGRLSTKSLARYLFLVNRNWNNFTPDKVLAQSQQDQQRFALLFSYNNIQQMPNLKFERSLSSEFLPYVQNPLSGYFKPSAPVVVLGSIRRQEEEKVFWVVYRLLQERPKCNPVIVPRHMQRVPAWQEMLQDSGLPWVLRSTLEDGPAKGQILLWDVFGELQQLYGLARAVYVGGSLVPAGGQNFLEPLSQGVTPCIGPHWENFAWVGQEIVHSGLVHQVSNEESLVSCLLDNMKQNRSRENVAEQFRSYVQARQGGLLKTIQTLGQEM